ncbi:hypothetical protein Ddye_009767 [Dipteronia dyeriana]|uniref:Reverse transcriptase domain-containing protein n=1 Tax=Dipteronia dyeriana TaxID=168575 RepID=A0AAD9XBZ6_9ROSI|nr:hypothetical protein Ddye_009767 [Dipteronia dyeriana]
MWRQKSRVKWLEGDKNSKFFHLMDNGRKRVNYFGDLFFDGVKCVSHQDVRRGVLQHFKDLFKKVEWHRPRLRGLNFKRLSAEEREGLETDFSVEEVWRAVCNCDGNKAPGPDGLTLSFIQANWEVIGDEFLRFMSEFHKDNAIVKNMNKTFIALVPKCGKPKSIKDFGPISLVGCMYKVLAKVLANRVTKVMNKIIGDYQMAFVKDRQVLDSVVIAEEIVHKWKRDKVGEFS